MNNKHLTNPIPFITTPTESVCLDPNAVGGKATQLAMLAQQGHPVPAFTVLTTHLFDRLLDALTLSNDLKALYTSDMIDAAREERRSEIADKILQSAHHSPIEPEIIAALNLLPSNEKTSGKNVRSKGGKGRCSGENGKTTGENESSTAAESKQSFFLAVRSSSIDEDTASATHAGLFETVLGITATQQLILAVHRVMASVVSAPVLAYQQERQHASSMRCGVILQTLIPADSAGVLFTANPKSGSRRTCLVEANYGLGEAVVSHALPVDQYEFPLNTSTNSNQPTLIPHNELTARIAIKTEQIHYDPQSRSIKQCPVDLDKQQQSVLSPFHLKQLQTLAQRLTNQYKQPQDCEWAFHNDKLYVLQTRDITQLPPHCSPDNDCTVWDNSNIQESFPGITTPLTFSVASLAYAQVYEQTARLAGAPSHLLEQARPMFRNLLGYLHGRIYYNINNWYRCLIYAPSFKRSKADMERMMGLEQSVSFIEDEQISAGEQLKGAPLILKAAFKLLFGFATLSKQSARFLNQIDHELTHRQAIHLSTLSDLELIRQFEQLNQTVFSRWSPTITNDWFVMIMNGMASRLLEPVAAEQNQSTELLLSELLHTDQEIESLAPLNALATITEILQQNPALVHRLTEQTTTLSIDIIRSVSPQAAALIEAFINDFGDRYVGELKLETVTLRQNPNLILPILRNALLGDFKHHSNPKLEENSAPLPIPNSLASMGIIKRKLASFSLKALRRGIQNREAMRLRRTRLFGLYRQIFLQLGRVWEQSHVLNDARDIFFLTWEEILSYAEGRSVTSQWQPLVALRRETFQAQQKIPTLKRQIVLHGNSYQNSLSTLTEPAPEQRDQQQLTGQGCYPGQVTGEVVIVSHADDTLDLHGKILCAERTDPGWTPLFIGIKAVIVQHGNYLSHSAILARELGIPTIINVPNATTQLTTGDLIQLDGQTGVIHIVSPHHPLTNDRSSGNESLNDNPMNIDTDERSHDSSKHEALL